MNRLLLIVIAIAAILNASLAYGQGACCGPRVIYSQPSYSAPSQTWPQRSAWEYERIEGSDGLFRRFRFRRDSAGSSSIREEDEFAWSLLGNGQYEQRGRLADLLGKLKGLGGGNLLDRFGKSEAGYERSESGLLKAFSYLGKSILNPKGLPDIPNTRDILPPLQDDLGAREQNAFLLAKQGLELQAQQQLSNNELRKAQLEATSRLASVETLAKANERRLAETVRAILEADKQAAIQLELQQQTQAGESLANIPIDNRELAAVVQARCWSCHGPAKQAGGVDFREARAWGEAEWDAAELAVSTGAMPKDGQPLSREQINLFRQQLKDVIRAGK